MKTLVRVFLTVSAVLAIGCQPNEKVIEKTIEKPVTDEKIVKVDETMTDSELADSGEQLLTFHTFPLAEKAFQMALIKNPDNLKAQFYTEGFLKVYTVYKGILTRIKPFVRKQGKLKELENVINSIPNVPARKYFLDGTEDIKTVSDLQNFFFEHQQNWNGFRKWLIKNYDKSLTLNLDPLFLLVNTGIEAKYSCDMIDESSGKAICNFNNVFQKKLGPADLMGLRQMVGGMVLYFSFFTSYNMEGFDKLASLDPDAKLSNRQSYQYLVDVNSNIFTLRQKNLLRETISIGSDFSESAKYAIKYQKELCPKGPKETRQRVGYLFHDGICVASDDEVDRSLKMLEQALSGPVKLTLMNRHKQSVETNVDFLSWFRNPTTDLKTIGPAEFDSCGRVSKLADKTLGGIYRDKNAEDFVLDPKVGKTQCANSFELNLPVTSATNNLQQEQ